MPPAWSAPAHLEGITRPALRLSRPNAAVRVSAHDHAGLERLLRYCARAPLALERLELRDAEHVVYRLPKPQRNGTTALTVSQPGPWRQTESCVRALFVSKGRD